MSSTIKDLRVNNTSSNSTQVGMKFERWGRNNNLTISNANNNINGGSWAPILRIKGSTNNESGGFALPNLHYGGKFLSLTLGNVSKPADSRDFQITFVFHVIGSKIINRTHTEYKMVFVNGPLEKEGWSDHSYYEKVGPYSSRLVNLDDLLRGLEDQYAYIKGITITVGKGSKINLIDFMIKFYNDSSIPANIFHLSQHVTHHYSYIEMI